MARFRGVVSVHNTTAHGPGSRDMYQEEAERVVALCGSAAPCMPGDERPMESRVECVPSAGLELLVEKARLGPLTIIATGPATDVASLILAAPETLENVCVVWLGGFGDRASYTSWQNRIGELNGRSGIQAWRALFDGPVDPRARPDVAGSGEDTRGSRPVRRWVTRARTAQRLVPGRDPGPTSTAHQKPEKNSGTWPASPPSPTPAP